MIKPGLFAALMAASAIGSAQHLEAPRAIQAGPQPASAAADPLTPPNRNAPQTAVSDSPPRNRPTIELAKPIRRRVSPPTSGGAASSQSRRAACTPLNP